MKINKEEFQLGEIAEVILDSQDNDGLIFVPKNIELRLTIENYFGKILINTIEIYPRENNLQISKAGIEQRLGNLDIKLLDRYLFKSLSDKSGIAYSPYQYFPEYDFSVFEKNRRPSDLDWAMFATLYIFSCNVLPTTLKIELAMAKYLRISEENFKRFLKKIPPTIFMKSSHSDSRGGNISFDAEILIKNYLGNAASSYEENPYLKFYSDSDLA